MQSTRISMEVSATDQSDLLHVARGFIRGRLGAANTKSTSWMTALEDFAALRPTLLDCILIQAQHNITGGCSFYVNLPASVQYLLLLSLVAQLNVAEASGCRLQTAVAAERRALATSKVIMDRLSTISDRPDDLAHLVVLACTCRAGIVRWWAGTGCLLWGTEFAMFVVAVLSTPPTSASTERLFSLFGFHLNKLRTRTTPPHAIQHVKVLSI